MPRFHAHRGALLIAALMTVPALAQEREISAEAAVFDRFAPSTFTVNAEFARGSGFLVDAQGLIATNAHVVENGDWIRVRLDDERRVEATIAHIDRERDVAFLRVHPSVVEGLEVVTFRRNDELAVTGERVIAIGSPLHQERALTTGVVSRTSSNALICDLNINPGSSGGPVFNTAGEVLGISTFGDVAAVGAGLAGVIRADVVTRELDDALRALDPDDVPSDRLLQPYPAGSFPLPHLRFAALQKDRPDTPYEVASPEAPRWVRASADSQSTAHPVYMPRFRIYVTTPPHRYHMGKRGQIDHAAPTSAGETTDAGFGDLKEWNEDLGAWKPTVDIMGFPELDVSRSVWTGEVSARFEEGLERFVLFRDGESVEELDRDMSWIEFDMATRRIEESSEPGANRVRAGQYRYDPAIFAPNDDGTWPELVLHVLTSETDERLRIRLRRDTVEQIWADFEPYYWSRRSRLAELEVGQR